jgi:hypothetical protein
MFVLHIHTKKGVGSAAFEMMTRADGNFIELRHRGTGEMDCVHRRIVERWLNERVASLEMTSGRRKPKVQRRKQVASVES